MESMDKSRRNFIAGTAAVGLASLFPSLVSSAQNAGSNNPRRIDVHHHFTPPPYIAFEKAHNQGGDNIPWVLEKDLEDMDKNGTATAIMSITTPGFWFGETQEVRKVMREVNEFAAKLRADKPGRFGSFAAVPMADPEGALREI